MQRPSTTAGFTLIEILLVIAIAGILLSIGTYWYNTARSNAIVSTTTDSIVSALEQARSNAISGKNGASFGVKFNSDSYVTFMGSAYSTSSASNSTTTIDSGATLTNTITDPNDAIVFTRLTGATNSTATVTVMEIANPARKKNIVVESLGNIGVVQ
ncbi:MAG TPA: GspH/FimT family pseudopilin [Candidatus Paceibacterota bacterium]|jgi:type IV fimbrial biogenesis protein FimT|nr:GspH/FimT family pseudopilin [Candidatus Paceibacterota bacterium]